MQQQQRPPAVDRLRRSGQRIKLNRELMARLALATSSHQPRVSAQVSRLQPEAKLKQQQPEVLWPTQGSSSAHWPAKALRPTDDHHEADACSFLDSEAAKGEAEALDKCTKETNTWRQPQELSPRHSTATHLTNNKPCNCYLKSGDTLAPRLRLSSMQKECKIFRLAPIGDSSATWPTLEWPKGDSRTPRPNCQSRRPNWRLSRSQASEALPKTSTPAARRTRTSSSSYQETDTSWPSRVGNSSAFALSRAKNSGTSQGRLSYGRNFKLPSRAARFRMALNRAQRLDLNSDTDSDSNANANSNPTVSKPVTGLVANSSEQNRTRATPRSTTNVKLKLRLQQPSGAKATKLNENQQQTLKAKSAPSERSARQAKRHNVDLSDIMTQLEAQSKSMGATVKTQNCERHSNLNWKSNSGPMKSIGLARSFSLKSHGKYDCEILRRATHSTVANSTVISSAGRAHSEPPRLSPRLPQPTSADRGQAKSIVNQANCIGLRDDATDTPIVQLKVRVQLSRPTQLDSKMEGPSEQIEPEDGNIKSPATLSELAHKDKLSGGQDGAALRLACLGLYDLRPAAGACDTNGRRLTNGQLSGCSNPPKYRAHKSLMFSKGKTKAKISKGLSIIGLILATLAFMLIGRATNLDGRWAFGDPTLQWGPLLVSASAGPNRVGGSPAGDELSRAVLATMSTESTFAVDSIISTAKSELNSPAGPTQTNGSQVASSSSTGNSEAYPRQLMVRRPKVRESDFNAPDNLADAASSMANTNGTSAIEYLTPEEKNPEANSERDYLEPLLNFGRIFIMGAIIVGDICGNSLVILSVCRHSKLRVTTNWFVVSLACADILVALFAMTFNASVIVSGRWLFHSWVCDFWNSCDVLASTASILHLCCISIDRYIAIMRPLDYPMKITTRRVMYALCAVWISSALLSYIPIFTGIYTTADHIKWRQENPDQCQFVVNRVYAIVSSSISFWIPCCIMVFTYWRIYREATRQEKFIYKAQSMMPAPIANHHHHHNNNSKGTAAARAKQRRSKSMAVTSSAANSNSSHEARIRQLAKQQAQEMHQTHPSQGSGSGSGPASTGVATTNLTVEQQESEPLTGAQVDVNNNNNSPNALAVSLTQLENVQIASAKAPAGSLPDEEEEQNSDSGQSTPTKRSISKMKREHKAAKTLGIIMGVFILCWLPFFTWYTPTQICGHACDTIVPKSAVTLLFWIGYFNSTLNPIIYAYFNHEFRDAFKKTLQWIFCCCQDLKCLRVNRPNDNQRYNCTYRSTQEIGLVNNS